MTNYNEIDAVNFSTLKYMSVSPKEYKQKLKEPKQPTPKMIFGAAVHCAVFTPLKFLELYRQCDIDKRKKEFKDFVAGLSPEVTVLKTEDYERVCAARDAVNARFDFSSYDVEYELYWEHKPTGLACKGRVDATKPGELIELKVIDGLFLPSYKFDAHSYDMLWHVQMGSYSYGLGGEPVNYIVAVQDDPPHDAVIHKMPPEMVEQGFKQYELWLNTLKACRETDIWPGIEPGLRLMSFPPYAKLLQ